MIYLNAKILKRNEMITVIEDKDYIKLFLDDSEVGYKRELAQ